MYDVDDDVLDVAARMVAREVKAMLDHIRTEKLPSVPTDYDVGTVLKYDGLGVLLRLRLTAGPVTVRQLHFFSALVMADDDKKEFDDQLLKFVAKTCIEFARYFLPQK